MEVETEEVITIPPKSSLPPILLAISRIYLIIMCGACLLLSLACFGLAIWIIADREYFYPLLGARNMKACCAFLMLAGCLVLAVSLTGLLGACSRQRKKPDQRRRVIIKGSQSTKDPSKYLNRFILFLVILAVLLGVGVAALIYFNQNVAATLTDSLTYMVQHEYGHYKVQTVVIDTMQTTLSCCGAVAYDDYYLSGFYTNSSTSSQDILPSSCCVSSDEEKRCPLSSDEGRPLYPQLIHPRGCVTVAVRWIESNLVVVYIWLGVLLLLLLLAVLFAMIIKKDLQTNMYDEHDGDIEEIEIDGDEDVEVQVLKK